MKRSFFSVFIVILIFALSKLSAQITETCDFEQLDDYPLIGDWTGKWINPQIGYEVLNPNIAAQINVIDGNSYKVHILPELYNRATLYLDVEVNEVNQQLSYEMEGWDSVYVGANTPTTTLLSMIKKERPDIIALSVTIMPHLKQLDEIITRARQDTSLAGIRIIVGGYPFNIEKDLWKTLKADGYAPDAQGAVEIANSLIL